MKIIGLPARAVAGTAIVGLAISVAGCSSTPSDDSSEALEVWTRSNTEDAMTYEAIFDAFTEETGIEVEYTPVPEFDTQLQARASQKDLPDVFINDAGSMGQYQSQGYILPVDRDALAGADEISDATWEQNLGTDGTYYGVPYSRQANIVMIRKDWREAIGADVPTTWDELSELALAFATEDPDGNGQDDTYGMVVAGSAQSGYIARWGNSYIWQAGGEILASDDEGHYTSAINTPEVETAMEWMRDQFCTEGVVVPNSINLTTAETPFFGEGTAGIWLTGPYNIASSDDQLGQENVEAIPMPEGPESATTFAEGENIYFGASSEKSEEQQALAEFLISAEAQEIGMTIFEGEDGIQTKPVVRLPVNENVDVAEVTGDERWGITADSYAEDSKAFPWNINFIPYRQILADGMNAMMADCSSDIPAGLEEIDAQLTAQLETDGLLP
ncbi:ABC transporter substrate-binding protein [Microbacterium excoecariae]|uniref:ABC transporter substrate-binding protein n=1 Tax=Microbacterium excoecariae TaxID=2715210 RepID=UPI00140B4A23|nr:sugar ABC transporter substrate-binding protein [Microbacterium excoecariae]NHI16546.1 sugar ABC transporter substrate-binding protein [Microbacterium excoecariae]